MMWFKLTAVVVALGAGGYSAAQIAEELLPQATAAAAQQSFDNVAYAAYLDQMLTGDDWALALERAVGSARNADALTVDGTTLRWVLGDDCFYADVPTPDIEPEAQRCA